MSFIPQTAVERRIYDSFQRMTLLTTLGCSLVRVEQGEVDVRMPFRSDLCQQQGFIHAGATTTIIDTACGYAALTLMDAASEVRSIEYKVNFLAPAIGEYFLAQAKVVRSGRHISVCTGEVLAFDALGQSKTVCLMQATMMQIHPK